MSIKNELATVFGSRPTWIDSAEEHGDTLRIETSGNPSVVAGINAKLDFLRNSDFEIKIINGGSVFEFRKMFKSNLYEHDFETQLRVDTATKRDSGADLISRLADKFADGGYPVTIDGEPGCAAVAHRLDKRGWVVALSTSPAGDVSAMTIEQAPVKPRLVPKAMIEAYTAPPKPNAAVASYRAKRAQRENEQAAARRVELERKINQKRHELAELEKQLETSA